MAGCRPMPCLMTEVVDLAHRREMSHAGPDATRILRQVYIVRIIVEMAWAKPHSPACCNEFKPGEQIILEAI